ncbi:37S ribosomal protein [Grosmannia clavigera kw1407]|uniref:37S ribosomal protein n=1 Tax=Grosmannia clavigera (strain kw1407 / UAMH 11150) TaxID=655863 RepID=F0XSE5_GROCL|nr:37S ribosomal protein [Grosmannia clavigera kw1407]EFW99638.1 37S ribosomal protein [Grosmannia clavigera kw1407]
MDKVASGSGLLARRLMQTMFSMPQRPAAVTAGRVATALRTEGPRALSGTAVRREDRTSSFEKALSDRPTTTTTTTTTTATPASSRNLMEGLADLLPTTRTSGEQALSAGSPQAASHALGSALGGLSGLSGLSGGLDDLDRMKREVDDNMEEYHFSIYSHKHNTHVTVSKPNRDVIVSMSCGNLGFLKAQRGSYDAAYQLGAYVCDWLYQRGWHKTIQRLEVTLRGFGPGREAVSKILLGNEGRLLRRKITRVADATRLKFGGTRSKKPRRLG